MKTKVSFKEIRRLAIPAIFAGIAEPLIGLVDTGVIGNLGDDSQLNQAAVGLGSTFYALLLWSLSQIRTSVSSLVSRYVGANKVAKIASLVPQTIAFGFVLGIIIGGLAFIFSEDIFVHFYGVEEHQKDLLNLAIVYFSIRIVGLPISLVVYTVFGVFRGYQNTLWIMKASLIGALVNVLLDYILVFGVGDFNPNMGIEGVAIASVMAQLVMMIVSLYFLRRKTGFNIFPSFKLNDEFLNMLRMSSNMLLRTIALNFAFYLANVYATDYGENYLAAHTILMQIWVFSFFFIDGFSNAGNALAGKLLGAKDYINLRLLLKDIVRLNLIVALFLALLFLIGYQFLGGIFSNQVEVVNLFNNTFWVIIIAQFINSVAFSYDGVFKGLGETAYLRNTLFVASFLVFAPCVLILDYFDFKLHAIWISFLVWNLFRGLSLVYKFKVKYFKLIK
jgi:MATE family multidrug resistance protein